MAFYMATTKIAPEKTAGEITNLLGRKGAKQILTEYECGEIVALSFLVEHNGKEIPFRLPLRWQDCFEAMRRDRTTPRHLIRDDQAKRTAWRIVLRWVEAQFALIETGMATLTEVMLPYVQVAPKETFYQRIEGEKFRMLPERT